MTVLIGCAGTPHGACLTYWPFLVLPFSIMHPTSSLSSIAEVWWGTPEVPGHKL